MSLVKNYFTRFVEQTSTQNLCYVISVSSRINLRSIFLKHSIPAIRYFKYIDPFFFISTHGIEELESFMNKLKTFPDHLKFVFQSQKERSIFQM